VDLVDAVAGVFTFQGFSVVEANRRGANEASGLLVRRGALEIAIAVVPSSVPLDARAVNDLLEAFAERPAARRLIAYAGLPTSAARASAVEAGAPFWDRERLVAEAGAALLSLADPDPFAPTRPSAPPGFAEFTTGSRAQVESGPQGRRRATLAPARAADSEAMLGALPVALSAEEAKAAAQAALKGVALRCDLEWVPAYLLDYHLEVEVRTPRGEESLLSSGSVLVSASGREVEDLERPLEAVEPESLLERDALQKALGRRHVSARTARERAREEALARTVRTVEQVSDRGAVTVIERHAWRPRGNLVDVVLRGTVLLPLFLVETERGIATVNASSGHVLRVAPFAGEATSPAGRA